jgi:hypothetical protein
MSGVNAAATRRASVSGNTLVDRSFAELADKSHVEINPFLAIEGEALQQAVIIVLPSGEKS